MTRLPRVLFGSLLVFLLLGACGTDDPTIGDAASEDANDSASDSPAGTTGQSMDDGEEEGMVFTAELTGAAEKPDPGDDDGTGKATITIKTSTNEVCFEMSVSGIAEANAAHIHKGDPGVAGPVVIELTAPAGGSSKGCSAVQAEIANEIAVSPTSFYVNVHNTDFPKGAVRGQLTAP
ncbi:MAG TPA: CHRD domain-containing protein [Acidimicrobiales bacterium]|nr:CHRD domain-containing protein [Acidimicrobiales bacterium]